MITKNKIVMLVVGLIIIVAAFFGGMKYGEAKVPAAGAFARGNFTGAGAGARGGIGAGRGAAGGFTIGSILSKDATSITVGVQGGGSKIVFTSASTTVSKMAAGTMDDLTAGTNVMVQGSANPDGSITAQSIQIRPAGAPVGGRGPAAAQGSAATGQ